MSKSTNKRDRKYAIRFNDDSLTQQSFGNETNINRIMARYKKTGILHARVNANDPMYGDFGESLSYQDALNKINAAQNMFNALPSDIRSMFDNSTVKFLDFVQDPGNNDEMYELGLLERPKTEIPSETSSEPPQAMEETPATVVSTNGDRRK